MPTYDDPVTYDDAFTYGPWPLPVRTREDVWRGFPAWWTGPDSPTRDGVGDALRRLWMDVGSAVVRGTLQRLRAHATGLHLDLVGLALGSARALGELDPAYRTRLGTVDDVVSPTALRAALDAIFDPLTPAPHAAVVLEPVYDATYCRPAGVAGPATTTYSSFAGRYHPYRPWPTTIHTRVWDSATARVLALLPRAAVSADAFARVTSRGFAGRSTFVRHVALPATLPVARNFLSGDFGPAYRAAARALARMHAAGVRVGARVGL